ncbi:hypothetical protein C5167_025458 [Papaver somniferum]|uniref:Uncharacterized protein n=1 Tax=Papaver somniferum TaxID=3469 RepID=A0A4Y7JT29_PAPSO|nr:hypothetical protein C5167_025458 [Papaver somniferum]
MSAAIESLTSFISDTFLTEDQSFIVNASLNLSLQQHSAIMNLEKDALYKKVSTLEEDVKLMNEDCDKMEKQASTLAKRIRKNAQDDKVRFFNEFCDSRGIPRVPLDLEVFSEDEPHPTVDEQPTADEQPSSSDEDTESDEDLLSEGDSLIWRVPSFYIPPKYPFKEVTPNTHVELFPSAKNCHTVMDGNAPDVQGTHSSTEYVDALSANSYALFPNTLFTMYGPSQVGSNFPPDPLWEKGQTLNTEFRLVDEISLCSVFESQGPGPLWLPASP